MGTGHNNAAHDAKFEYTKIMADNKESSSEEETTLEQKGRKVDFKKHRPRPRPRNTSNRNSSSRDSSRSRSRHKSNNSRTSGDTPFNSSTYTTDRSTSRE